MIGVASFACGSCGLRFSVGWDSRGRFLVCAGCGTQYRIAAKGLVRATSPALLSWQFSATVPTVLDSSPVGPEPPGSKEDDECALASLTKRKDEAWRAMYRAGASSPAYSDLEREWRALLAEIHVVEERSASRAAARRWIDCDAQGHPLDPWPSVATAPRSGFLRRLAAAVVPGLSSGAGYDQTRWCRCRSRGETRHVVVTELAPERTLARLRLDPLPEDEELQCAGCGKPSLVSEWPPDYVPVRMGPYHWSEYLGERDPTPCPRCKQKMAYFHGRLVMMV